MKLLLLLSLVGLAVGQAIISKPAETNDVGVNQGVLNQVPQEDVEQAEDKKVDKRSYGWNPWIWPSYGHGWSGHGHGWSGHGWPSYSHGWSGHGHGWHGGWSGHGHGWHGGLSYGWPIYISSGHGWHGHGGWHSKW
ncbi:cold and drought-regulated protein CORA-like [Nasonia vitripennis]|uniref:Uncharacterized protein n=1 Tax=Nasonia vitripennis TaxID=7425 RepID=A0A7M7GHH6_NASVI|nr:cold and drought-regulated protein CORA-like [Nasonia vitripennis]